MQPSSMIRIPSSWHVSVSVESSMISVPSAVTGTSAAAQSLKHFIPECTPSVANAVVSNRPNNSNTVSRQRRKKNRHTTQKESEHEAACYRKVEKRNTPNSIEAFSFPRSSHSNNSPAIPLLNGKPKKQGTEPRAACVESEDETWFEDCAPNPRKKPRNKRTASSQQTRSSAPTALVVARKRRKKRRGNNSRDGDSGSGHPSVADLMMGSSSRDADHTDNDEATTAHTHPSDVQASLSLFGMGLLHRLEMQAKQRRKRAMAPAFAEDSGSKKKGDAETAQKQCLEKGTVHSGRERAQKQGYALDDQCIYNFKEAQTSACFPRQSAQEACQVCPHVHIFLMALSLSLIEDSILQLS